MHSLDNALAVEFVPGVTVPFAVLAAEFHKFVFGSGG